MSEEKKKILVFVDWYLPGFKAGGPIRSCVGLVDRLSYKYNFKIVTGNTDLKDYTPYSGVTTNAWNKLSNGTMVFYCDNNFLNFKNIKTLIQKEQPDIIYLNSMYSVNYTLLPLLVIRQMKFKGKVFIAPRGMLSKGALALKSFKKQVFLNSSKIIGLFKNVTFHASTGIEVQEIKDVFGNNSKIHHAINLTPLSLVGSIERTKLPNELKLIFLGRISKVKNLIQCLKLLKRTNSKSNIIYNIYGPAEDKEYLDLCKSEIKNMPPHVCVNFQGEADNPEVNQIFQQHHFMFQLTQNENFGHAIVESFTAGCPVIISDRTPWRNLKQIKCGWDLNLKEEDAIVDVLEYSAAMDQKEYNEWSEGAFNYSQTINDNQKAIEDHILMFES